MPTALVTGSAGFVGYHLSRRLLADGYDVVGFDGLTDYYDVSLKQARQSILQKSPAFKAVNARLEEEGALDTALREAQADVVVHLAAQAGVRYSIDHPRSYVDSNLIGTFNLLEAVRANPCAHLMLASSSSVFGANTQMPYVETAKADMQMSFYAATKKAGEAMAHSYAHLYNIPTTVFRFFTVYGPWGRPDMALFKFTRAMLEGRPIDIYNNGQMARDFTYIDDLVEAIRLLQDKPPEPQTEGASPVAPYRLVNIGNAAPVPLMEFVAALENALGIEAQKTFHPMQAGDVRETWADTGLLHDLTGYRPRTSVEDGVAAFIAWYKDHYAIA
ncbi:SDR family NAD(P)-dependent oxidoreductase [Sulfitobacter sp. S190]|uniref:SDR family NAD(P)-dependent oxidoreductase n=1 Tax=Sulfitobacter sp. S190 TaxID=2867022 RepID=UPI0021A383BF|nr:SDR family NAD(P)-dependent oxidoreductase [Sulfitobacter sp. S190]UWR24345.1 SDR family NAD(P)-dependent oxidoreductase [Sulfitobacter sp. S190]